MYDLFLREMTERASKRRWPGAGPRVLECGVKRWNPDRPTTHRDALRTLFAAEHVGLDVAAGQDVDVVADLHDLSALAASVAGNPFDAVLLPSVLEHLRRPWLAAAQLARVTRPGGLLWCETHQSFPLHAYPGDYFRFSADALAEVFAADTGWRMLRSGHSHPARVTPLDNSVHATGWNFLAEAYLNSWCLCERV